MSANERPVDVDEATIERVGRFIANDIRAELVCCDVYDRLQPAREADGWADVDDLAAGHSICYWGEAAARIAERAPEPG